MPEVNAIGDLVLTRPDEFRALADPLAIALTDRLRRDGPTTTAALAEMLGTPAAGLQRHLEELERVGIVARDDDGWRAVASGFVFEIPDDPEAQTAARKLANVMLLQYADVPQRWVAADEPRLDVTWARASGLLNARPALTADELRALQEEIERLLAPYLGRPVEDAPGDARRVRILGYFLPETTP